MVQQIMTKFGSKRLNKKKKDLRLHSVDKTSLENAKTLSELGKLVALQTGLSTVILKKTEKGWSIGGKINPTIADLASYSGVPQSLQPLIDEVKHQQGIIKPNKEFFISLCKDIGNKHGAEVLIKQELDKTKTPYEPITGIDFKLGDSIYSTVIVLDTSRKTICPACDTNTGKSNPHNVIPASLWASTISNELTIAAPTITVNFHRAEEIISVGGGRKGPAISEDQQCPSCENIQGAYSLLQRKSISTPSTSPEFIGKQFQLATQGQIEALTKEKIDQVIHGIKKKFDIWEKTGAVKPGDDFHTLANDPIQILTFLQKIRAKIWILAQ
jgi:hypothetical protein